MTQNPFYNSLAPELRTPENFTRPLRDSYQHVGARPKHPFRQLTPEEITRYGDRNYVLFEQYPESDSPVTGRFWTLSQMASGCQAVTKMAPELAETYAVNPKFYSATYCVGCGTHLPLDEFVWSGTTDVVGS
jgi:hypothetical protein